MAIMERWVHQLKDHDAWDEIHGAGEAVGRNRAGLRRLSN